MAGGVEGSLSPRAATGARVAAAPHELVAMAQGELAAPDPADAAEATDRPPPLTQAVRTGEADKGDIDDRFDLLAGPDLGIAL